MLIEEKNKNINFNSSFTIIGTYFTAYHMIYGVSKERFKLLHGNFSELEEERMIGNNL